MNENQDNKLLTIIVIVVLILVTTQSVYNIVEASKSHAKEKLTSSVKLTRESDNIFSGSAGYTTIGRANVCLNIPPIVIYDCNLTNITLNTSIIYNCTFIAVDANADNMIFTSEWMTYPVMFNITPNGSINFNPKRASLGHINQVRINISDNSGCSNNITSNYYNITVNGTNRPPYLAVPIDNQIIVKDHSMYFYLGNHFIDPDEDELGYFFMLTSGNSVTITVVGQYVEVKGTGCGNSTAYYVAIDPFGLTAQSNTVNYEVQCPDTSTQSAGSNSEDTGKGGGGSGNARSCEPDWRCNAWSQCRYDNRSYRRCVDYNACTLKYLQYFTKNCTYAGLGPCKESWECNEWSTCVNNIHTRICLDLQSCETNISKPLESENCTILPSCFNGIQDQGETAIDCGGPCGACRHTEQPAKTTNWGLITLIIIILSTGTITLLIYVFRSKIAAAYRKLTSKKQRIRRKAYINNKQKEKLLLSVNIVQARLDEHKIDHAIDEMSIFVREYFKQLLTIENLDKQELIAKIVKLKDKDLEKILVMFYAKIINTIHLRNKGVEIKETEIQSLIDEILHEIYLIAEFSDQDAINSVKDRITSSKVPLDIIYTKLSDTYIALKFGEILVAKSMYKEILKEYDKLSTKDKTIPYTDIIRAFHAIDYLEKQYKNQK